MNFFKKYRKICIAIFIILIAIGCVFYILHHPNAFNRRELRDMRNYIQSYGIFAPLIVLLLMLLSTLVPPLPLPVPLIELATGVIFGFLEGAVIIWISQILSSILAFYMAKFLGKKIKKLSNLQHSRWNGYKTYVERHGYKAVIIIRGLMAAPFNIISYLAGFTRMSPITFMIATAVGTIPESLLYSFLGSQLRNLHLKLAYLSLIIVLLGLLGFIFTLVAMYIVKPQEDRASAHHNR